MHPKPVPLLGKQASGEVLWAGNGENSHLIQQTPLLSLETVSGMEVGSTCVPLERNSSTGQRWAMESSRALTAKQNRKNFAGSSHRFADFSQEPWDMLPLWEDKPFFPRDRNNSHDACGIQGMDNFPWLLLFCLFLFGWEWIKKKLWNNEFRVILDFLS